MPGKIREADLVQMMTHPDTSRMFVTREGADEHNLFNNKIHYHNFWELEFIISGCGVYEINNISFPIRRGMVYLTTPADYHTYSLKSGESFEMYNVQFRSDHLDETVSSSLYSCTEPIALSFEGAQFDELYDAVGRLDAVFSEKKQMYEIVARNMIENICVTIARRMDTRQAHSGEVSIIRNAVIFIKNNYRRRITLNDVSSHVKLSPAYFSHVFSLTTGVTFSVYVRNIRLDAAANLLKSTEMTVKEICYSTGFGNRNYFTEVFSERFGMSPIEYRKKHFTAGNNDVSEDTPA